MELARACPASFLRSARLRAAPSPLKSRNSRRPSRAHRHHKPHTSSLTVLHWQALDPEANRQAKDVSHFGTRTDHVAHSGARETECGPVAAISWNRPNLGRTS